MNDFRRFKQELKHANPYRTKSNQFAKKDDYHHLSGELPDDTENQLQPKKVKKDEIKIKEKAKVGQQIANDVLTESGATHVNKRSTKQILLGVGLAAAAFVIAKKTITNRRRIDYGVKLLPKKHFKSVRLRPI